MKRFLIFLVMLAAAIGAALGQTVTSVTGTVLDKNGIPYAGGTIQVQFNNVSGGASPTVCATGAPFVPPNTPVTIANNGTFSLGLLSNSSICPAATTYTFVICSQSTPSTTPDPMLVGSQCFTVGPITIAGATQSITSTINATPVPTLMNATVVFSQLAGGTGVSQVASQSILSNGTGIAPGTSQAQTPITITGLTTNSMCNASPPAPLPPSWNGIVIPFVAVSANTATVYLTNSSTSLVTPIGYQVNVKCIL